MKSTYRNRCLWSQWFVLMAAVFLSVTTPVAGQTQTDATNLGEATATGSGPLTTQTVVEKLEAGRFVPAERVKAGEEVHYTIRVTNPGARHVENVVVTKLVPIGLQYTPRSAVGPACKVEVSSDGGTTFIVEPKPKPGQREYTHLRWIMSHPLPPGATALLRFRATFR